MSSGIVAASRGQGLEPSSTSNALVNSQFTLDNYPVGYTYPNNPQALTYKQNSGTSTFLPAWSSGSSLYFNNPPYATMAGNQYLYSWEDYGLAPFLAGYIPRINKIYGISNLFPGNTLSNDNADRGAGSYGDVSNVNSRIVNHTTLTTIDSSTSMDNTAIWVDSTKWCQVVDVPDGATTIKFGAQIRIPSGDKLRALNWAGIAITQDFAGPDNTPWRYVDYFGVRHTNATFSLPTGQNLGGANGYNWAGLGTTISNSVFYTPEVFTATEHAMLDQDNYDEFTKVEYTFTMPNNTETGRKCMMHIFFAENAKYMYDEDTELTGGFQYYDPFIEFPVPTGPVATIGTKVVSGYGLMSDPLNTTFSTSTDGSGSGATLTCTSSTKNSGTELWRVDDFVVNAVGTGYAVGDEITMNLGFPGGPYSTCLVVTIS